MQELIRQWISLLLETKLLSRLMPLFISGLVMVALIVCCLSIGSTHERQISGTDAASLTGVINQVLSNDIARDDGDNNLADDDFTLPSIKSQQVLLGWRNPIDSTQSTIVKSLAQARAKAAAAAEQSGNDAPWQKNKVPSLTAAQVADANKAVQAAEKMSDGAHFAEAAQYLSKQLALYPQHPSLRLATVNALVRANDRTTARAVCVDGQKNATNKWDYLLFSNMLKSLQ